MLENPNDVFSEASAWVNQVVLGSLDLVMAPDLNLKESELILV